MLFFFNLGQIQVNQKNMQESKGNIFKQEEEILKKAKEVAESKSLDDGLLLKEYNILTTAYDDLLKDASLLTSISDRFQEKLKLANDRLEEQANVINNINLKLDADNRSLKSDLKLINKKNHFTQLTDYDTFKQEFSSKDVCLSYIAKLKWNNKYTCKKCGNGKFCEGNAVLAKRCTKCRYDESATSFTLLHKCKFPIEKAFFMSLLVYHRSSKISSYELSNILDLRQKTCWSFKQKIVKAMEMLEKDAEHSLENWHEILLTQ